MAANVDLSQLAVDREKPQGSNLRKRSHWLSRYVLPALLLVGFAFLAAWSAADLLFPPHSVTVVPVHVTQSKVNRLGTPLFKAAGWVEPRPTPIRVAALAPGVVESLLVVEDQPVQAGEPVARLITRDAQLGCEAADADLKLRQAELEVAQATLKAAIVRFEQPVHLEAAHREADAELAKTETALKALPFETTQAEAEVAFARQNLEGKKAAKESIGQRVIDRATSDLAIAEAKLEQLHQRQETLSRERAALELRRDALKLQHDLKIDETKARDEAQAQVRAAEARLRQAEVAVEEAQLRLDRMTIRAPVSGRVLRLVSQPGTRMMETIGRTDAEDGSTVVTMYRPESLQVRVDVRFENIPKVQLGQPVEIASPVLSAPLTGHVLFVSSQADIQKNTLQVKVGLDSPPATFKPEMLVDVTFLAPQVTEDADHADEESHLLIPAHALQQGPEGPFVWLADRSSGVARKAAVKPGARPRKDLSRLPARSTFRAA